MEKKWLILTRKFYETCLFTFWYNFKLKFAKLDISTLSLWGGHKARLGKIILSTLYREIFTNNQNWFEYFYYISYITKKIDILRVFITLNQPLLHPFHLANVTHHGIFTKYWILDQIWLKTYFLPEKVKQEHYHQIQHIRISVGTKFHFYHTILTFWTKCAQKEYLRSKIGQMNITIKFNIGTKFHFKPKNLIFCTKFVKGVSGQKQKIIEINIFELIWAPSVIIKMESWFFESNLPENSVFNPKQKKWTSPSNSVGSN